MKYDNKLNSTNIIIFFIRNICILELIFLNKIYLIYMKNIIVLFSLLLFSNVYAIDKTNIAASTDDPDLFNILDMKVSTAAKYEQNVNEAPASVTIITSDDIDRYGYKTLIDVLSSVRSFNIRTDRDYFYTGVRGIESPNGYNNTIVIMINGHITNENVYNSPSLWYDFSLDMSIIDRIEIIRGPGSSLYGTGAMTATINIITKSGKKFDGLSVSSSTGTEKFFELKSTFAKNFDDFDFLLSANYTENEGSDLYFKEFDTPGTNSGISKGLDWLRANSIFLSASYSGFTLNSNYNYYKKGLPTAPYETIFNNSNTFSLDTRFFVDLSYSKSVSQDLSLTGKIYFDNYKYDGTYAYDTLEHDSDLGEAYGINFMATYDIFDNNRFIAGLESKFINNSDYKLWNDASVTLFDKNNPYNVYSMYFQDCYQFLEYFSVTGGIRYDKYSNYGDAITPKLAFIWNPLKTTTLKLLYNEGFRIPNIYETLYTDYRTQKSNEKIKPEKIRTYELVVENKISDVISSTFSIFDYNYNDMITLITDENDGLSQFQNYSMVSSRGVEIEFDIRLQNGIWAYTSYSYQSVLNKSDESKIPNSPENIFNAGLSYANNYFTVSLESVYESGRETFYQNETEPFIILNSYIKINPNFGKDSDNSFDFMKYISASLKFHNIFDVNYSLPAGLDYKQDGIQQLGRYFIFELSCRF
jgi:iron complex outermembrane receptor protein